ncbi:MAG TPA: hypothetical protein VFQ60_03120 [Patescibacteria group bacterium]|nr:hypothetical protein [Patescibacteria group bacterium]
MSALPTSSGAAFSQAARPDPSLLKKKPVGRNAIIFLAVEIFLLLVLLAIPYYFILRSGLLRLPGSSLWYRPPVPTRTITSAKVLSLPQLESLVQYRLRASVEANPASELHRIALTDEELTGALRGAIQDTLARSGIQANALQLISEPGSIEAYARFTRSVFHFDLLMTARVLVQGQRLQIQPVGIRLGGFSLSEKTFDWLVRSLTGYDASLLGFSFGGLPIQTIRFEQGQMQIDVILPQT